MTTPHTGLILSPFDKRWSSGIDWESLQREANAKDQKAARIKERNAGKAFLEQPPGYRPPKVKPMKPACRPKSMGYPAAERIPRAVRKLTSDFPGTFVADEGSKTGRLRAELLSRGPMSAIELASFLDVTRRQVMGLMKHDMKRGSVKRDGRMKPTVYFVPGNPPKDLE